MPEQKVEVSGARTESGGQWCQNRKWRSVVPEQKVEVSGDTVVPEQKVEVSGDTVVPEQKVEVSGTRKESGGQW